MARETPLDLGAPPVPAAGQRGPAQARGPAAGLQLQAARRLQQDRAPARGRVGARHHHRERRQPLAGRGVLGPEARAPRGHRDAADDAADQGGRGALDGRRGGAVRRQLRRRQGALRHAGGGDRAHVHPPLRRSAGDCGAGHHRRRDPAAQPGPAVGGVRAGRRRRPDRGHCRLSQGAPSRREGDRRRAVRGRRDVPVAGGRAARAPRSRRHLCRRRRRARGGRADVSDRARDGGRDRPRQQRRSVRRDQGHLRRHAHGHGAGRRAGGRGTQDVGRARGRRAISRSSRC